MAAWPWQAGGGGGGQPAQASSYWGNQSYAAGQQQAQYAGMPTQQNYQSPTGTKVAAPSQQTAWGTPTQGAWQSAPASGGSTAPQQSQSAQTNWAGQGGWGQPAPPPMQNPNQNTGVAGGYAPGGYAPGSQVPAAWWQQGGGGSQQPSGGYGGVPPQYDPRVTGPQGVMPGGTPPPANADTNGYQMPQVVVPPASRFAMPGWDNNKWNDLTNQDPKYVVGRILSGIPGRTDQMDIATARIAAAYPGAKRVGTGDIQIPGVGVIDILMKSSTGGSGWWWGAGGGDSPAPAAAKTVAPVAGKAAPAGPDPYAQMLMQLASGGQQVAAMAPQAAAAQTPYDITQDPKYQAQSQQLQQLQTQLAEMQANQNKQRGLNVTYF